MFLHDESSITKGSMKVQNSTLIKGLFRKKTKLGDGGGGGGGVEDMQFSGVSKSMWNFQGLIKNEVVEFPRVTKKISSSPGVWFLWH